MGEIALALTDMITQLHHQDTASLKLITELISIVSRVEARVSILEEKNMILSLALEDARKEQHQFNIDMTLITDDLATQMVIVRHNRIDPDYKEN